MNRIVSEMIAGATGPPRIGVGPPGNLTLQVVRPVCFSSLILSSRFSLSSVSRLLLRRIFLDTARTNSCARLLHVRF